MIACSANELATLARRAARGAGLAWGLAEEAGRAAHWLALHRLPGVGLLARQLSRIDGVAYAELLPDMQGEHWAAREGALCPLVTGAALGDCARDLAPGRRITLTAVERPLLLAAFLGRAAKASGRRFELRWPGVCLRCDPGGLRLDEAAPDSLTVEQAAEVTLRVTPGDGGPGDGGGPRLPLQPGGVEVAPDDWAVLKALAARTYVPATEESRLHGAGAGLKDND